jgi:hypothetical protein
MGLTNRKVNVIQRKRTRRRGSEDHPKASLSIETSGSTSLRAEKLLNCSSNLSGRGHPIPVWIERMVYHDEQVFQIGAQDRGLLA